MTPLWACATVGICAVLLLVHHALWRRHTSLAVEQAREVVLRQLSHDIRSPLAALETVLDKAEQMAEEDRSLIGAAATRLRDMANTLAPHQTSSKVGSAEPLLLEVEYAVSQVRQTYRARGGPVIDVGLDKSSFSTAFTSATRAQLHRAVQNHVALCLSDSTEAQRLLVRCERERVEVRNVHTQEKRTFIPSTAPSAPWFVNAMTWPNNGTVVVTDDDEAVHTAWHLRLNALAPEHKPRLLHLKTLADLAEHVKGLSVAELGERVFWVDCEFTGATQTGLDAITNLNIGKQSVLVTSHYDDASMRSRCMALGTKLLPKTLLHNVPLRPRNGQPTVVLIDDDTLVHHLWRLAARGGGHGLQTFANPDDFFRAMDGYARTTPVYIDSQLGAGLRGEDVAKTVHERGFPHVYLTTGRDPASFPAMPWVKAIRGKEPPF